MDILKIIEGCKKRNIKDQELLYKTFMPIMKKVCSRYIQDPNDSKDILQDAFIKVFNEIKNLNDPTKLEAWIKRIVINLAYEYYRKKKKLPIGGISHDPEMDHMEHIGADEQEEEAEYMKLADYLSPVELLEIVNSIEYPYNVVFKMYYIDNISHKEIAEILQIKENSCRVILHRSKSMLKAKFTIKFSELNGR